MLSCNNNLKCYFSIVFQSWELKTNLISFSWILQTKESHCCFVHWNQLVHSVCGCLCLLRLLQCWWAYTRDRTCTCNFIISASTNAIVCYVIHMLIKYAQVSLHPTTVDLYCSCVTFLGNSTANKIQAKKSPPQLFYLLLLYIPYKDVHV